MSASRFSVVGRIRPKTSQEVHLEDIVIGDENAVRVKPARYYTLDKVFGPESSQIELFDHSAKNVIAEVLRGYNATIFTYGQTGSGKTFTMKGEISDEFQMGLIPNSLKFIFHELEHSKDENSEVKVSYLEIYNNKIFDLLSDNKENKNIKIYEDKNQTHLVLGTKMMAVKDFDSFIKLYSFAESNRHFLATGFNENSSRSHCILQIFIKKCDPGNEKILTSKLNLVDLAGSEKASKISTKQSGSDESVHINKSLSHLANVIYALACNNKHIPYRNCTLTRLLKEGLGGNSFVTIIICLSPTSKEESIRSLEFGHRAKFIKNKVVINKDSPESWKRKYEKTKEKLNIFKVWFKDLLHEVRKRGKDNSASIESFDENTNISCLLDSFNFESPITNSSVCDASTSEVNCSLHLGNTENEDLENSENVELIQIVDNLRQQIQEQLEAKEKAESFIEQTESDLELFKEKVAEKDQELALINKEKENLYNALQVKEEEFQTLKQKSLMKNVIHELEINILIKSQKHKEIEAKEKAATVIEQTKSDLNLLREEVAEKNQELALINKEKENLYNALQMKEEEFQTLKQKSLMKNVIHELEINILFKSEKHKEIEAKEKAATVIEQTKSDLNLLREEVAENNQELALIIKEKENLYNALQVKEEEFQTLKQKSLRKNFIHELEMNILNKNKKYKEIEAKENAKRVIEQTKSDLKLFREEMARKNQELALIIEEKENLYNALQVKDEEFQTFKQKSLMKNVIHELEMKILMKSQKHKEIEIKKEAEEVAEKMRRELSCVQQQLQDIKISFAEKERKLSSTIQNLKNDVKKLSFERFNLRDQLDQRNSSLEALRIPVLPTIFPSRLQSITEACNILIWFIFMCLFFFVDCMINF